MMKIEERIAKWNGRKSTTFRYGSGEAFNYFVEFFNENENENVKEMKEVYFEQMLNDVKCKYPANVFNEFAFNMWVEKNEALKKEKEAAKNSVLGESANPLMKMLGNELVAVIGNDLVNKIESQLQEKFENFISDKTLIKVVEYKNERQKVDGILHEQFETILNFVALDEPVMLVGPAGTGKNVICAQLAKALGLDFYFTNKVSQDYQLTGFVDAMGNYISTQFYEAFTKGGLFMFDEIDASCENALTIINAAIANRYFDFPLYGRIKAHPDFRVVACANTYGTGASMEYVGRNQLDGATLNRFAMVKIGYDKKIEENCAGGDKRIVEFCRYFREAAERCGAHVIVSYRDIGRLNKMINVAKMNIKTAIETCLVKGIDKDSLVQIGYALKDCAFKDELMQIISK